MPWQNLKIIMLFALCGTLSTHASTTLNYEATNNWYRDHSNNLSEFLVFTCANKNQDQAYKLVFAVDSERDFSKFVDETLLTELREASEALLIKKGRASYFSNTLYVASEQEIHVKLESTKHGPHLLFQKDAASSEYINCKVVRDLVPAISRGKTVEDEVNITI